MLWAGVIWALLSFHKKIQFTKTMVNIIFQFTVLTYWGKHFSPNVTSNTSSKYILSFSFTDKYFINVFLGFGDMFWWPTMTPKQDQGQVIQIITSGHRWWRRGFPNYIYRRLFFQHFQKTQSYICYTVCSYWIKPFLGWYIICCYYSSYAFVHMVWYGSALWLPLVKWNLFQQQSIAIP